MLLLPASLIDGQPSDQISILDRGLMYGGGLFETVRIVCSQPALWALHWQRLEAGLTRLNFSFNAEALQQSLLSDIERLLLVAQLTEAILKITITRGIGQRGYRYTADAPLTRIVTVFPATDVEALARTGIKVRLCSLRLARSEALAGLKHLNRMEQVIARNEWNDPDYYEGILNDTAGNMICGTMSNLFLVKERVLLTADVSGCGIAGTRRRWLLENANGLGLEARVGILNPEDLSSADEVFFCNALIGILPAVEVADRTLPSRDISLRLREALLEAEYQ